MARRKVDEEEGLGCRAECCLKLREVQDIDPKDIQVFLGNERRTDLEAIKPARLAVNIFLNRYTRPRPCPGKGECPEECPCDVFETKWGEWKRVDLQVSYVVPGIGTLQARIKVMRRVGRAIGWCEPTSIESSNQFFVPDGADVALTLKPGVKLSKQDVKRLESLFTFDVSSDPEAATVSIAKPFTDAAQKRSDT